jgi:hypothetical protein
MGVHWDPVGPGRPCWSDRKRAQQQLTAMLMRHGRVWRDGCYWTAAHRQSLAAQRPTIPR